MAFKDVIIVDIYQLFKKSQDNYLCNIGGISFPPPFPQCICSCSIYHHACRQDVSSTYINTQKNLSKDHNSNQILFLEISNSIPSKDNELDSSTLVSRASNDVSIYQNKKHKQAVLRITNYVHNSNDSITRSPTFQNKKMVMVSLDRGFQCKLEVTNIRCNSTTITVKGKLGKKENLFKLCIHQMSIESSSQIRQSKSNSFAKLELRMLQLLTTLICPQPAFTRT